MPTFRVDEVAPARDRLPTRPLGEHHPEALAIGGDPATRVIDHRDVHALLGAVGLAFAQHRPLVLSPDAVWLTIAQGVAQHVRLHAEALRPRLVRHQGRERLTVTVQGQMPSDPASWASAVSVFRDLLAAQIGDGRARLFECDFSTSSDVDRIASQIVLLDAYSPYFSLWMTCVCGIPSITLTGAPDDWRRIRERIDVLSELDLAWWCRSLAPIADHFVRAASGDVDRAFWRRIYNPVDAYGGDVITGWITRLYPYIKQSGVIAVRNPMLELALDEPRNLTPPKSSFYSGPGLHSDAIPDTRSRVTVHVVDQVAGRHRAVALCAGLVGIAQDAGGALRPIAGWHLEEATVQIDEVLERVAREHRTVPVTAAAPHRRPLDGAADLIALFSRFETATLFDGARAWRVLPPGKHDTVVIADRRDLWCQRIIDLADGRSICFTVDFRTETTHWFVCSLAPPEIVDPDQPDSLPRRMDAVEPPTQIPLLGTSLAALLDAALDADGEIDHLETGHLAQLLHL